MDCTGTTEYSDGKFAHSWAVAEAEGPTSKSVCQTCGATSTDRNSIDTPTTFSYQSHKDQQERPINDI